MLLDDYLSSDFQDFGEQADEYPVNQEVSTSFLIVNGGMPSEVSIRAERSLLCLSRCQSKMHVQNQVFGRVISVCIQKECTPLPLWVKHSPVRKIGKLFRDLLD